MKKLISVFSLILLLNPIQGFSQKYFSEIENGFQSNTLDQDYMPVIYRLLELDKENIKSFLYKLPENSDQGIILELPTPGEEFSTSFKIWKTPLMQKELQEKYMGIQTFTAVSLENPSITAKLDFTEYGFHAVVYDGLKTYYIDPVRDDFSDKYMVYYKKDYERKNTPLFSCEIDSDKEILPENSVHENLSKQGAPSLSKVTFGSEKKTYRIAISATGEYAQAVSGNNPTKSQVLSKIITTLNRVTGIYEREMSVSFQLVNDNDDLIFLNGNTDPFSNNDAYALLYENRQTINQIIGSGNYDLGHVFSTGAGGLASLGVVCTNWKAQGATGSQSPYGDSYDIDYVAHEIGHQMGANHTMSQCSNENLETAFEPGSGSSIMGYAGICYQNNLQNHSDAYFHSVSLLEMRSVIQEYGTCATTSPGTTSPESPSIQANYAIPYKTPFELTAPTASVSGASDTLFYSWEQFNNAVPNYNEGQNATKTMGPTFRSFPPDLSETRVFPNIENVIQENLNSVGERTPQVARQLSFVLTVRNIKDGFGSFEFVPAFSTFGNNNLQNHVDIEVIDTGEPFKVTAPNTNVTWTPDETETITWNIAQTDISPIDCEFVDIFLSEDGGYTYPYILAENVPNSGSASIIVPEDINTSQARVKVKGKGNIFFDISDQNFSISNLDVGIAKQEFKEQISLFPNPVKDQLSIKNPNKIILDMVLINSVGQNVYESRIIGDAEIYLGNNAPGIYFLYLKNDKSGVSFVEKILVQP